MMIRCNLAVLLAERNLKISKVSADTGISRTTLTALSNNYSQGIQFDTANKLCVYLKVTLSDLFSFVPVTIEEMDVVVEPQNPTTAGVTVNFKINNRGRTKSCELWGTVYCHYDAELHGIGTLDIDLDFPDAEANSHINELKEENSFLQQSFSKLSTSFLNDIAAQIQQKICDSMDSIMYYYDDEVEAPYALAEQCDITLNWPY